MATETTRNILITGTTRGLGRALVPLLAERGHVLAGCGRSVAAITELTKVHPAPHNFSAVDIADDEAVERWAATLRAEGFVPDLVLNNAALMNDLAPLWGVSAEEFNRLLAVNVSGIANIVRTFLPGMISRKRGVVVNVSSGWGRSTSPEVGPYCTTKYAVEGYSGSLAQELPEGLACVLLNPGVIDTDMLRKCMPDVARECEGPDSWAARNVESLLALGPQDNGRRMSLS
jgi:NAD(P)-dependent dehydrogenase (short-subunit alcohol dehydrogenase family)